MKSKRTVMEISDRAKGEGLQRTEHREPSSLLEWPSRNGRRRSQIPLFNAAGLQIRPNGFFVYVLFLFCFICQSHAQLRNFEYKVIMDSKKINGYISFYGENNYSITIMESLSDDLISSYVLSYGWYELEGKNIHMTDSLYGYKMSFIRENKDSLTAKKTFPFMKAKSIGLYSDIYAEELILYGKRSSLSEIKKEVERIKVTWNTGKGEFFFIQENVLYKGAGYSIDFKKNGSYRLSLRGFLLSKGQWIQDRNVVYLFDEELNTTFFLLFEGDTLIGKSLPGSYYDDVVMRPVTQPYIHSDKKKKTHKIRLFRRNK